jgi:hypothetical protein
MELIIIMYWSIWIERNSWLFRNEDPSVDSCRTTFKREMDLIIHRSTKKYTPELKQWLINFAYFLFLLFLYFLYFFLYLYSFIFNI